MPSSSTQPAPFEPGPSLARVIVAPHGWTIDTRGPLAAHAYHFTRDGEAAEFARTLRDDGGWSLRFGPGCAPLADLVAELDEAFAA